MHHEFPVVIDKLGSLQQQQMESSIYYDINS